MFRYDLRARSLTLTLAWIVTQSCSGSSGSDDAPSPSSSSEPAYARVVVDSATIEDTGDELKLAMGAVVTVVPVPVEGERDYWNVRIVSERTYTLSKDEAEADSGPSSFASYFSQQEQERLRARASRDCVPKSRDFFAQNARERLYMDNIAIDETELGTPLEPC